MTSGSARRVWCFGREGLLSFCSTHASFGVGRRGVENMLVTLGSPLWCAQSLRAQAEKEIFVIGKPRNNLVFLAFVAILGGGV